MFILQDTFHVFYEIFIQVICRNLTSNGPREARQ